MRRVHTPALKPGQVDLDPIQAHHVRDVLRLEAGDELEVFDDAGHVARGVVIHVNGDVVTLEVRDILRLRR